MSGWNAKRRFLLLFVLGYCSSHEFVTPLAYSAEAGHTTSATVSDSSTDIGQRVGGGSSVFSFQNKFLGSVFTGVASRPESYSFEDLLFLRQKISSWWQNLPVEDAKKTKAEYLDVFNLVSIEMQAARIKRELESNLYKKDYGDSWQAQAQERVIKLKQESLAEVELARKHFLSSEWPRPNYLLRDLQHIRIYGTHRKIMGERLDLARLDIEANPEQEEKIHLALQESFFEEHETFERLQPIQLSFEKSRNSIAYDVSGGKPELLDRGDHVSEGLKEEIVEFLTKIENGSSPHAGKANEVFNPTMGPSKMPLWSNENDSGMNSFASVLRENMGIEGHPRQTNLDSKNYKDLSGEFPKPRAQIVRDLQKGEMKVVPACVGFAVTGELARSSGVDVSPWFVYSLMNSMDNKKPDLCQAPVIFDSKKWQSSESELPTGKIGEDVDLSILRKRSENKVRAYWREAAELATVTGGGSGVLRRDNGEMIVLNPDEADRILKNMDVFVDEEMKGVADVEKALTVLSSNAVPSFKAFPTDAEIKSMGEIPDRRVQAKGWSGITLHRSLNLTREAPSILREEHTKRVTDSYGFLKNLVDSGGTPTVILDGSLVVPNEDWVEVRKTGEGGFTHAVNVVGYGDAGVNPQDGSVEPYLILRDSMSQNDIHVKMSASNFSAMATHLFVIHGTQEMEADAIPANYEPPKGNYSISDDLFYFSQRMKKLGPSIFQKKGLSRPMSKQRPLLGN
jgi:hypothetical protein